MGENNNTTDGNDPIPPLFSTAAAKKQSATTTPSMGVVAASPDVLSQATDDTQVPTPLAEFGSIAKGNTWRGAYRGRGRRSAGRQRGRPVGRRGTSALNNPKWSSYEYRVLISY